MKKGAVFVSVGTHPQQFNRLLEKIDELIEKKVLPQNVFCQSGASTYAPKHFETAAYMGLQEFEQCIEDSSFVISHGGEGNIGLCLKHKKKCIAVPRLARFDEHTNDHQTELVKAAEDAGKIMAVWDISDLETAIKALKRFSPDFGIGNQQIIRMLDNFVKK